MRARSRIPRRSWSVAWPTADLVIVCTPVADIVDRVCAVARHCPSRCLDHGCGKHESPKSCGSLTDVCEAVRRLSGSHPMAGSEKTGPENARADLLENRVTVVTPTKNTCDDHLQQIEQFWSALGSRVVRMTPRDHDQAVAMTSHATHVIAAALAAATPEHALPLAASGWRDTTRIAAGDPQLWLQILLTNRQEVLKSLGKFEKVLAAFRVALAARGHHTPCATLGCRKDRHVTLWEVDIYPAAGQRDLAAESIAASAADLGLANQLSVAHGARLLAGGPAGRSRGATSGARTAVG